MSWDVPQERPLDVASEVFVHKTTLNFVDHCWEVWAPLMRGCLLVILAEEYTTEPQSFLEILGACRVSRITVVPSLLRTFLLAFPDLDARLPLLQHWTVSGEALPQDLAQDCWRAACGLVD